MTYLFVAAGGTHLFQPLDVAINKPFKDNLRKYYLAWLIEKVALKDVQFIETPNVQTIANWCLKSLQDIKIVQVRQAFELSGIGANLHELFNNMELNRKLLLLLETFLLEEDIPDEREYMDQGDVMLEQIVFGQELILETDCI